MEQKGEIAQEQYGLSFKVPSKIKSIIAAGAVAMATLLNPGAAEGDEHLHKRHYVPIESPSADDCEQTEDGKYIITSNKTSKDVEETDGILAIYLDDEENTGNDLVFADWGTETDEYTIEPNPNDYWIGAPNTAEVNTPENVSVDDLTFTITGAPGDECVEFGGGGGVGEPSNTPVERLEGENRIKTSVAVSKHIFKSARYAVVATALNYPDALAGSSLAGTVEGPILLSEADKLSEESAREMERLGVDTVYMLGGEQALSEAVERDIKKLGIQTERLGGEDRFETAAMIGNETIKIKQSSSGNLDSSRDVLLVNGMSFADAVSVGQIAAKFSIPIVLTNTNAVPAHTSKFLEEHSFNTITIAGGTSAVSRKAEREAKTNAGAENVVRLGGANRYETSVQVAQRYIDMIAEDTGVAFTVEEVWTATGADFPDALSASAAVGNSETNNLLVLINGKDTNTDPNDQNQPYRFFVKLRDQNEKAQIALVIVGGENAVNKLAEQKAANYLDNGEGNAGGGNFTASENDFNKAVDKLIKEHGIHAVSDARLKLLGL